MLTDVFNALGARNVVLAQSICSLSLPYSKQWYSWVWAAAKDALRYCPSADVRALRLPATNEELLMVMDEEL